MKRLATLRAAEKVHGAVYLTWLDSMGYSHNGWMDLAALKRDLPPIQSCGFVVQLTEDSVTLALSYLDRSPDAPDVAHCQQVPLFAITSAVRL